MKQVFVFLFCLMIIIPAHAHSYNQIPDTEFEITINDPVEIKKIDNGHYFIDFGKAYFGTLQLKSTNSVKNPFHVHLGERLSGGGLIDRDPGGTIRYQYVQVSGLEADQIKTIELPADERNSNSPAIILPDSFGVILPFRYCELENLPVPIEGIEIRQKAFHYVFNDEASHFTSSDSILDAVWDLCKHTIKATSFAGYYVDGDRERIPYEADAFINQLSHYCVDHVYSLARRTNEYFLDHPTWPTEWILHTVMLFYYDYLYTGDSSSLIKNYDRLKAKTLMDLERDDELITTASPNLNDGLMQKLGFRRPGSRIRDIVDWPENERAGYDMVAVNTVVNSFYCQGLKLMAEIAGVVGNRRDSDFYKQKFIRVQAAINQKMFDRSRGVYIDGEGSNHASLHANMFPLAFDLVPKDRLDTVIGFIKSKGMACSVYGAQYLLEALFKNRESSYALALITDTGSDRSWWNMIKTGSTMTLEAWDIKYKPNLDWNHAWATAPANIVTRFLWGITPEKPGFIEVRIDPQLDDLTFSKIKVPTIRGSIDAEYNFENGKQVYTIALPGGVPGKFHLAADKKVKKIMVNGKILAAGREFVRLEKRFNVIEIRR